MAIDRMPARGSPSVEQLTERLDAAERGRYEAEAKYEALMRQLPAAIYVYSPEFDGPTFNMSPYIEELLGVPPEVFTEDEEVWDRLIHPEDRDRARIEYEWFLLGVGATDANVAVAKVTDRIAEAMAEPFRMRAGELSLRSSVGCALFPVDGSDAPDLLRRADEAMYEQKRDASTRPTRLRRLA